MAIHCFKFGVKDTIAANLALYHFCLKMIELLIELDIQFCNKVGNLRQIDIDLRQVATEALDFKGLSVIEKTLETKPEGFAEVNLNFGFLDAKVAHTLGFWMLFPEKKNAKTDAFFFKKRAKTQISFHFPYIM